MKFRKKPVVVDAVQWTGNNLTEIIKFIGASQVSSSFLEGDLTIPTLEGEMRASVCDWIIKGVNGEYYPCKPDIFEKTYEPA